MEQMDLPCFQNITNLEQDFSPLTEYKKLFGEVSTPFHVIETMLDMFHPDIFCNPHLKWLDPAAGKGYFMIALCQRLDIGLSTNDNFKNINVRRRHILENMIFMVELNPIHTSVLIDTFGPLGAKHIYGSTDFLQFGKDF